LHSPIFLHSFAFSVGSPRPIESLWRDGVLSAAAYEDCIGRGITSFCAAERPLAALSSEATARTLSMAGIAQENVARVDLRAQDCSAFSAAVEVAAERIANGAAEHVLLVLTGHVPPGASRYSPELGTVFGDGAAACIVSSKRAGFELIAVESWVRSRQLQPGQASQPTGEQLLQDFQRLRNLLRTSYECAAVAPVDLTAVFGTHGSRIYLELMAEAADVPYERVYAGAMQEFGHVLACDNLIALSHFLRNTGPRRDRVFCLIGWSPWSAGVILLRELATPTHP
jgi:3-oxoacyl-[acyl-carrier-protein] synthase III